MEIIHSDWLGVEVGLFTSYDNYVETADENGIEVWQLQGGTNAFYQCYEHDSGETFFVVCFLEEKPSSRTIVHESSHIADHLFIHFGMEPCTETRAYFHAWLFEECCKAVEESKSKSFGDLITR